MLRDVVAIIGAHGTGKSTLARFLLSELNPHRYGHSKINLITDVARGCPHPIGARTTVAAQEWIFTQQKEVEMRATGLSLIDNCVLGQYAYYRYWFGDAPSKLQDALEFFNGYAAVVMLPSDSTLLADDGVRPVNPEFQAAIDIDLRALIAHSTRSVFVLPKIGQYDRNQLALDLLSSHLEATYAKQVPIALGFLVCGDHLLLNRRTDPKVPQADRKWDVIAGRVEFGEQPQDTIRRECQEEIGLTVEKVTPLPLMSSFVWDTTGGRFQSILLPFFCPVDQKGIALEPRVTKVSEVRWVRFCELNEYELLPNLAPYIEYLQSWTTNQAAR